MPPKFPKFDVSGLKSWNKLKRDMRENKKQLGNKLVPIHGGGSTRVFPAKTDKKDQNYGYRIDRGSAIHGDPTKIKFILQVNQQAKDTALQDLIKKSKRGTHTRIAEAVIDTTKPGEEKVEDLITQFGKNMSDKK